MSIDETVLNSCSIKLNKFVSKTNSKKIIDSITEFTINYITINETPWLIEETFLTKFNEIESLFNKNDFLKNSIKNKKIDSTNICSLSPEDLDPESYSAILYRKELEEYRKNNKAYSTAFICKKCKSNKSEISERQTRSGDEPTTIYITCVDCGYSFSF